MSYLFIFPGIVTIFYIKFIFGGLQFKLRSINHGGLNSYTYGAGKKKDIIIEPIVDIGIEREEDPYD